MSLPWSEKHRPKSLREIVGNRQAKDKFLKWLESWKIGCKPILLYGPPGVGKTTLVQVAAREHGYELIEMNASDERTREKILKIAGRASTTKSLYELFSGLKGKLILMDEVDGIFTNSSDLGGVSGILDMIKVSKVPIILIANNPWIPELRQLRNVCEIVEFKKVKVSEMIPYLRKICQRELISADEEALRLIAENSEGDVRSAVNDLQSVAEGKVRLTVEDVRSYLSERDRQLVARDTLIQIFSAKGTQEVSEAIKRSEVDLEILLQLIHDNLPYQVGDLEDLAMGYESLSKADVIFGRIIRSNNWKLVPYLVNELTKLAMIRRKRVRLLYPIIPRRALLMKEEERKLIDEVCEKITQKCHVSKKVASFEFLPILESIMEANLEKGLEISRWLELEDACIDVLRKKSVKKLFTCLTHKSKLCK